MILETVAGTCPFCESAYQVQGVSKRRTDRVVCGGCKGAFTLPLLHKFDDIDLARVHAPPPRPEGSVKLGVIELPARAFHAVFNLLVVALALVLVAFLVAVLVPQFREKLIGTIRDISSAVQPTASFSQGGSVVNFRKTFTFFVPGDEGDPKVEQLDQWLVQQFAGWTRWRVTGKGGSAPAREGYFYQASLADSLPDIPFDEMKKRLMDSFGEKVYLIEQPYAPAPSPRPPQ